MTKRPREMIAVSREFDLEKGSFLASGITDDELLLHYRNKLDHLYHQFIHSARRSRDPLARAEALFKWLWTEKPFRYKPGGRFRLNEGIDAQLSKESQSVGNCLGLTLLYNCLLKRIGVVGRACYLENAFGIGPHVLTVLKRGNALIDIENSLPEGFDYKGHLDHPLRINWGDRELVADIYHSLGNELFLGGDLTGALENYEMSLHLNPGYEKARLNKVILLDKMSTEGRKE